METSRNLGHVSNGVRPSSGAATSGSSQAGRQQTDVAAPEDGRTPPLTSRNLWPLGVILTLSVFFAGTVGLVVMACSQRVDLVSPDYYERELKFQSRIDQVERTHHAASQASVAYDTNGKCITLSLPAGQAGHEISGRIELYRPSAAGMDRTVSLAPDAKGVQRLDAAGLAPGLWKVRVSWTFERQDYFLDEKVVVGAKPS